MVELRQIKNRPVPLRNFAPHVSSETAFAIDTALSVDPKDRFASYDQFIQNLEYARGELRKQHHPPPVPRVVKMGAPSVGWSWTTFATVALVVSIGVYACVHRERPAESSNRPGTIALGQPKPNLAAEAAFDEARRQLVERKFVVAAATFHTLYAEGRLPEPKNSWAAVHEALSETLGGRPDHARKALQNLSQHIAPTTIGLTPQLVSFMNRLTASTTDASQATPGESERFDSSSYEAFAYLLMGAAKFEAGQLEEGAAFMARFKNSKPIDDSAWVADYRPLAAQYLSEHATFLDVSAALSKADPASGEAAAALKRVTDVKPTLTSAALRRALTEIETESSARITAAIAAAKAAKEEMEAKQAEARVAEENLLANTKLQLKNLCESHRFAEALAAIRSVDVKLEHSMAERDLLARRIEWLVNFKKHLVEDLNAGGYTMPLTRKNGQQVIGGVRRATEQQVEIRVQFGSLPIAWTDLSPQSILQMARSYMRPTLPPSAIADRKWEAGVFCLFAQLVTEGHVLLDEASLQKEDYRAQRTRVFGQPTSEASSHPSTKLTPKEKAADEIGPSSGLEMADQPLNKDRTNPSDAIIKGLRRPPTP
jgi:hypothetical protein